MLRLTLIPKLIGTAESVCGVKSAAKGIFSGLYPKHNLYTPRIRSISTVEEDDNLHDEELSELKQRIYRNGEEGHQVLVIQPYIKWGKEKKRNTTPQLMLEESIGLVESLRKWRVVDGVTVSLETFRRKQIFGSGNLEEIRNSILSNQLISAVFVSIERISGFQRRELEKIFHVPVYDRYSMVLNIFKERAKTKEAKLQVALAEVPYLRSFLRDMQDGAAGGDRHGGSSSAIGGSGESYFETRRRLLLGRERKVKEQLEAIRSRREVVRVNREKKKIPVVSVVGYTNAGKTSLIRALTDDPSVIPEDRLFATLDVTAHAGYLPCNLQTLYVDTVGFLSDLPTGLIEAFAATLEDALHADIIIHVRDVSHPEAKLQLDTVNDTLASLNLPDKLRENTILIANKVDKLVGRDTHKMPVEALKNAVGQLGLKPEDGLPVCATRGLGLRDVVQLVQKKILSSTGQIIRIFRVPSGGEAYQWFHHECAVIKASPDQRDPQMVIMEVVIHESVIGRLKKLFPKIQMLKVKGVD